MQVEWPVLPLTNFLPVWQTSAYHCDPFKRSSLWTIVDQLLAEIEQTSTCIMQVILDTCSLFTSIFSSLPECLWNVSTLLCVLLYIPLLSKPASSQVDYYRSLVAGLPTPTWFSFFSRLILFLCFSHVFKLYFHIFYGMWIVFQSYWDVIHMPWNSKCTIVFNVSQSCTTFTKIHFRTFLSMQREIPFSVAVTWLPIVIALLPEN